MTADNAHYQERIGRAFQQLAERLRAALATRTSSLRPCRCCSPSDGSPPFVHICLSAGDWWAGWYFSLQAGPYPRAVSKPLGFVSTALLDFINLPSKI